MLLKITTLYNDTKSADMLLKMFIYILRSCSYLPDTITTLNTENVSLTQ